MVLIFQNNYIRCTVKKIGKKVKIWGKVSILNPSNVVIGDYSHLNEGCFLNARGKIIIGKYCHLSQYVQVQTTGLDIYENDYKKRKHLNKDVSIEDGVWIACGAIISPGVTLHEGCIILPGAVVTKDVPAGEVWGGVPAKHIQSN